MSPDPRRPRRAPAEQEYTQLFGVARVVAPTRAPAGHRSAGLLVGDEGQVVVDVVGVDPGQLGGEVDAVAGLEPGLAGPRLRHRLGEREPVAVDGLDRDLDAVGGRRRPVAGQHLHLLSVGGVVADANVAQRHGRPIQDLRTPRAKPNTIPTITTNQNSGAHRSRVSGTVAIATLIACPSSSAPARHRRRAPWRRRASTPRPSP